MKKYIAIAIGVLALASCNEKNFHVEGTIENAADSVLYLENVGIGGIDVVDSVRLDAEGRFNFSGDAVTSPEFYRLRVAGEIINVAIDSTETVTVSARYPRMASEYDVKGSENCLVIKELALMQQQLTKQVLDISDNESLNARQTSDSIVRIVDRYKADVLRRYIFATPDKPQAYFALFQTLGGVPIFNPAVSKDDVKAFAAVATSWDTYYPGSLRAENLHNIALEAMNNERIQANDRAKSQMAASQIEATGLVDIRLTDNKGRERTLRELKGSVVLLDFHLFAAPDSPQRILMLRGLYNKLHAQGLEIYQVSIDADEHFWKQQTAALPWISVRDEAGIQSPTLGIYNVRSLPEYFLIDRDNNIVGRSQTLGNLEQAIRGLL